MKATSEWYAFVADGSDAERITVFRYVDYYCVLRAFLSRNGVVQPYDPDDDALIEYIPVPLSVDVRYTQLTKSCDPRKV